MHRSRLSLLLVVAALTLVGAATWALEPAAGRPTGAAATADPAASLSPIAAGANARSELIPATGPGPILLSGCEITKECICGGGYVEISCSGNVSCTAHARYITCDGFNTYCPPIGSCPP
jgi:hypothetical protein